MYVNHSLNFNLRITFIFQKPPVNVDLRAILGKVCGPLTLHLLHFLHSLGRHHAVGLLEHTHQSWLKLRLHTLWREESEFIQESLFFTYFIYSSIKSFQYFHKIPISGMFKSSNTVSD